LSRFNAASIYPFTKMVYDSGNFGNDVILQLFDTINIANGVSLPVANLNAQGAVSTTRVSGGASSTFAPLDENIPIQNFATPGTNAWNAVGAGANTDYSQTFDWAADMDAFLYKVTYWIPIFINVSAFTSGSANFNTATVSLFVDLDGTNQVTIYSTKFTITGLSALVAASKFNVFLLTDSFFPSTFGDIKKAKLKGGMPVHLKLTLSNTVSGVLTYQSGLFPYWGQFFNAAASTNLGIYPPILAMHLHAAGSHADIIIRDPDMIGRWDLAGQGAGIY